MLGTVLNILCIFPLDSHKKKFWEMNSVHRWWQLKLKIQKNTATRRKAKTGSTSVQLQPLMIYSKPLLFMKGAPFSGRGYHHQDSFACQLRNTVSMCFLDHAHGGTLLSLPTIMT